MAWKSETENSRLQAGPWTWRVRSSVATASEQRGHWLNLDLLSHSPSRCSMRLAISTTWEQNANLYTKSSSCITKVAIKQLGRCTCFKRTKNIATTLKNVTVYLSTFIAASQHRTVFPIVKVQSILGEWLILFTAEYAQAEISDQAADQTICLQSITLSTVTLMT